MVNLARIEAEVEKQLHAELNKTQARQSAADARHADGSAVDDLVRMHSGSLCF